MWDCLMQISIRRRSLLGPHSQALIPGDSALPPTTQVLTDPRLEQLNRESLVRILRAFKGSNVLDFRGMGCPECKARNVTGRLTLVGSGSYDVSFVCNRIGCYRTFFSERNVKNLQGSDAQHCRPGSAGSGSMYN